MYYEIHDNKRANTAAKFLEKALDFFPFEVTKILLNAFGLSETVLCLNISKNLLKIYEASSSFISSKSFKVKALDSKL